MSDTDLDKIVDIITFAEASWGLKLTLRPVQKFVLKMFYGIPLDDTTCSITFYERPVKKFNYVCGITEKQYLMYLTERGRVQTTVGPNTEYSQLILSAGRRASKSTLAQVIALYEVYRQIHKQDSEPSGVHVMGCNTGVTKNLREQMFRDVNLVPLLQIQQTSPGAESVRFQTLREKQMPDKQVGSVLLQVSTALSHGQHSVTIMDEYAHSANHFFPQTKLIALSTPKTDTGDFAQMFHERKPGRLCLQIPTWEMNTDVDFLRLAQDLTDTQFRIEYGAEFLPVDPVKQAETSKPMSVRMPPALQKRMDEYQRVLSERADGIEQDNSKILFKLLEEALGYAEKRVGIGIVRDPATPLLKP